MPRTNNRLLKRRRHISVLSVLLLISFPVEGKQGVKGLQILSPFRGNPNEKSSQSQRKPKTSKLPKERLSVNPQISIPDTPEQRILKEREDLLNILSKIDVPASQEDTLALPTQAYKDYDSEDEADDQKNVTEEQRRIKKTRQTYRSRPYNLTRAARNKAGEKEKMIKNYSKQPISTYKLVQDTKLIQEAETADRSTITICCVALRENRYGYFKKFAFSNAKNMSPKCRNQAEDLGYAVIKAPQSHAEGQFLQFLYTRARNRPELYTHIVGIGCSRRHCPECDLLLQLSLGKGYKNVSAVISSGEQKITKLDSTEPDPSSNSFTIKKNVESTYRIASTKSEEKNMVSSRQSDNYKIPDLLKKIIEQILHEQGKSVDLEVDPQSRYK